MRSPARTAMSAALEEIPVVAVLRARHAGEYPPVVEALVAGGVRSVELTLSTDAVFDHLTDLVWRFGPEADVGVGTITCAEEAERAIDAGAAFLVTPVMQLDVVEIAVERGIPVYPGGLTPTELCAGWSAGATAVKLFPASTVGPGYLAQLSGPFPAMRVLPSGGIDLDDAADWIRAGAAAVSVGGPLLRDAFRGGSLDALTERSAALVTAVVTARAESS